MKNIVASILVFVILIGNIPSSFAGSSIGSDRQHLLNARKRISRMIRKSNVSENRLAHFKRQLKNIRYSLRNLSKKSYSLPSRSVKKKSGFQKMSLTPVGVPAAVNSIQAVVTAVSESGKASYYANKFEGRTTASGEVFSNYSFTAAHKTLAFGTKIKVINKANNKSVIVIINDRGPYVEGRIIDLSSTAFSLLDNLSKGVINVDLVILE